MASVNVIYGLVLAVIISGKVSTGGKNYPIYEGFAHFAAGLVCGLSALGGGYAVGDSGNRYINYHFQLWIFFIIISLML
jgi:ATP synthase proteolipid subunit